MENNTPISVFVIVKNEENNLLEMLQSVSWANEIIIVDSGSTDNTLNIARQFTQQIYFHEWQGFGLQKNRALSYTNNDWVLSLDADERVTVELKSEILAAIHTNQADGYFIPRKSQFLGKFVNYCGWYPDYVLRLFKRKQGYFSNSLVHETVIFDGVTNKLTNPLLHYSYRDKTDIMRKIAQYSNAAAQQMYDNGKIATLNDAYLHACWAFVKTYFFKLGFLDGLTGWNIANMNATTTYKKYKLLTQYYD